MKEKFKNLFKNKNFWIGLSYSLILIFSILFSYSKGFVDGVLVDDEIRTEIIDSGINELKKSKIEPKKAFDFEYFNIESNDNIVLVAKNNLNEIIIKTDIIVGVNEADDENYNVRLMFSNVSISDPILNNSVGSVVEPTFTNIKTINWLYFDTISKDLLSNGFLIYFEFINNNNVIVVESTFYYLNDLLEAVEHSSTYYNNFLDLSSFFTPSTITCFQTFNEIRIEGLNYFDRYQEGIDKGKEIRDLEYQQTNSFFANVWDFIETATEKTLAIFNINILPGIPLYFLIVIPIAIGLIGWLFKLLQR